MAGVYRPRHPERTVLYRVLFHHFERFLAEYEDRFEREYGFFRPIVKEVVEKYLDCGNPKCGFARIRCPDCAERSEVYCRRGQVGNFIGRSRNSWRHRKKKYLSLNIPLLDDEQIHEVIVTLV